MNIQEAIDQALRGANGRAVSAVPDVSAASGDIDVMKLAAALNFIGANLEDSAPTVLDALDDAEKLAASTGAAAAGAATKHLRRAGSLKRVAAGVAVGGGAALGLAGARRAKQRMAEGGGDPNDIGYAGSAARGAYEGSKGVVGGAAKGLGAGGLGGAALGGLVGLGGGLAGGLRGKRLALGTIGSSMMGAAVGAGAGAGIGAVRGGVKGLKRAYNDPTYRAESLLNASKAQEPAGAQNKTAGLVSKALKLGGAGAALGLTGAAAAREDRAAQGKDPNDIGYAGSAARGAGEALRGAARGGLKGLGLGATGGALGGAALALGAGLRGGLRGRGLGAASLAGAAGGALLGGEAGLLGGGLYGGGKGLLSAYRDPARRAEARDKTAALQNNLTVPVAIGAGMLGRNRANARLAEEGLAPDTDNNFVGNAKAGLGGLGRAIGYGALGALPGLAYGAVTGKLGSGFVGVDPNVVRMVNLGQHLGIGVGVGRGYKSQMEKAEKRIAEATDRLNRPENLERLNKEMERIAKEEHGVGLADLQGDAFKKALTAAKRKIHQEKQSSLGKFAEDAINPAQISAGPAPAFSGEVMPAAGAPVFGGAVSPEQLVAMKAQKVRDRINSEMGAYVSQTGDGYNLDGHLSIFNK